MGEFRLSLKNAASYMYIPLDAALYQRLLVPLTKWYINPINIVLHIVVVQIETKWIIDWLDRWLASQITIDWLDHRWLRLVMKFK